MLTFLSWLFLFGLSVISAYSVPDWNIHTQISDMAAFEPVLQNEIPGTPSVALSTADGSSEFARLPPNGGDIVSFDEIFIQGGSGCPSDTRTHPRRIRVRDEKFCPASFLQPNGEEGKEHTRLHASPDAQEGSKQNTGGNGDPKPPAVIPPKDSKLPYLFIPEEDRPKENLELCPEAMYPVPVCGRPSDAYTSSYPYPNELTVDPCYPCM